MSITFSVYANENGEDPAIWTEQQDVQVSASGEFEVLLGAASKEGLPTSLFDAGESRWLGVHPDGAAELPRILLVSVPFALRAHDSELLAGRPASAYALQGSLRGTAMPSAETAPSGTEPIKSLSGTVATGTPNYLAKFLDAATVATSNVIETALGLGVDVPAPTQKLDINGRMKLRARGTATSGFWLTDSAGAQQLFVGQIALDSLAPFGIWHGNAWRLALTSSGDLGLGVGMFPTARLDLAGREVIRASDQGSSGVWLTGANGIRSLFIGQTGITSNDSFGVWHGGAWRFIVDKSGNVGIGGVPEFPLDLRGRMLLRAPSAGTPAGMWFSGPSDSPQLFLGQTASTAAASFGIMHGNDWRFVLMPNGNIGVGTTTPTEKLEVAGNLKLGPGGKLVFSDGSSLGSVPAAIASLKPQDTSVQVVTAGNEVQLAVAASGVTSSKLADASVTASKLADHSVTGSKIVDGTLSPTAVAGVAATLGANTFNGSQQIQGDLNITGKLTAAGYTSLAATGIILSTIDGVGLNIQHVAQSGNGYGILSETQSDAGIAVYAFAHAASGTAMGVLARTSAASGTAVYGEATDTAGENVGVRGISRSGKGIAIRADALGISGTTYGVKATAAGDNYTAGVYGESTATATLWNTYGVYGRTAGKYGIGVMGYASHTSGNTFGLYGRVESPGGVAGMFVTGASTGNVLLANNPSKRIFRLDASGNLYVSGTLNQGGADYAESIAADGSRDQYQPGDVLVISTESDRTVALSTVPYATTAIGIFSTKPGTLGSKHEMGENPANEVPVAMVGIVPCKVTTENGPIRRGDLLVTSSLPGRAMRGTDPGKMLGAVVGKALQSLDQGEGTIEVLVTLQ